MARHRWFAFLQTLPRDALDASGIADGWLTEGTLLNDAQKQKLANRAKEKSELIGFWVTWHLAGGFDELERWGWHRATIYRKLKRFRDEFGEHPDQYVFPWITLDLQGAWTADFLESLGVERDA